MRKDVKIGLAIGGVLLAVLIVYLLVPKDAGRSTEYGQGDPSSLSTDDNASEATGRGSGNGVSIDGAAPESRGAGDSTDRPLTTGAQPEGGRSVADGSAPNDTGVSAEDESSDAPRRQFDWNAMLSEGVMPEKTTLMATSPQPTG